MRKTAWTSNHGSSLPSDRISPSYSSSNRQSENSKSKRITKQPEPPKSKEVRRLETLLSDLRSSSISKKDPKGGCYCQAREHSLSTDVPICRTCGLVLCSLNLPSYACPHCATPLLTGHHLDTLIQRIETQLLNTIAKEIAERERAVEVARKEAGAFPTLSGSFAPGGDRVLQSSSNIQNARSAAPQPQTHKVISLNSKTKKLTVSSYTNSPAPSQPASRGESENEVEEPFRVPPPPAEVVFVRKQVDPARPWKNYRIEDVKYLSTETPSNIEKQHRKRRKGKKRENESSETGPPNASVS